MTGKVSERYFIRDGGVQRFSHYILIPKGVRVKEYCGILLEFTFCQMKILLVEDEVQVVSFLKMGLEEHGHSVSVALDGQSGFEMLVGHEYDLVLLDIMLPGINGMDFLRQAREKKIQTPIIMLTALGTTENVISGLETGADDYLVKPFKFEELIARITAVTRRSATREKVVDDHILSFADIVVDDHLKSVKRNGEKINLTHTEYRLLCCLIRNKNRVLTREQLLNQVWGIDFELTTNVVDVYVNYLRKKIEKEAKDRIIHTVVGIGYVLKIEDL
ncbi:DNA-binding response regulator, OmpR family, contains REC and winged-helix (wHTH) domain [Reichenbachiella agariperforans]|uniref:DNA-binding response regulator, OmpR family, contains REC and winged-helix (WHTH) domain n=2 Tax=Reichenbachiella agariperforans TaxID=156994 RepID=A0A1M6UX51_REIAG|nr:DNA-binding response regulator, OmpR family, contains REC and winged-helix (wHTH) domain [Reichenbachiella agariperforans]